MKTHDHLYVAATVYGAACLLGEPAALVPSLMCSVAGMFMQWYHEHKQK